MLSQFAWAIIIIITGMLVLPDTRRYLIHKADHVAAAYHLTTWRYQDELAEIQANHKYELTLGKSTYLDCLKYNLFKRLLTGCGLQALQQLTVINFVFYYGTQCFKNPGFHNSFVISLITNCVNVGSTFPGLWAVEK